MSTYEGKTPPRSNPSDSQHRPPNQQLTQPVEHNTSDPSLSTAPRRRRPDLSTFFATLSEISPDESRTRPHAVPVPGDVSAAFYSLAEALEVMRRDGQGGVPVTGTEGAGTEEGANPDILSQMIRTLLRDADMPPREVEGVNEEFCDG